MNLRVKKLPICSFIAILPAFSYVYEAQAWWDQGHQMVAQIALQAADSSKTPFLSSSARDAINTLLNVPIASPGSVTLSANTNSFPTAASWADSVKSYFGQEADHNYADCHYINVPVKDLTSQIDAQTALAEVTSYYNQHATKLNSISCVDSAIKTLETDSSTQLQKAIALRMITHIVGDISQPLHSAEYSNDRGGNEMILDTAINVNDTEGNKTKVLNLHALWDSTYGFFPQYVYKSSDSKVGIFSADDVASVVKETGTLLNLAKLKKLSVNSYESGNVSIINWVADSFLVAQNKIYYQLPLTGDTNEKGHPLVKITVSSAYAKAGKATVEELIYTSGVHLAKLLTAIFDPNNAEQGYVNFVQSIASDATVSTFPPNGANAL